MLDLVWISYPGLHIDHDLQLYLFFDSFFIAWFWMCIWILCRCWEWACGNCETQRVAWRVIEVIAIYFGIYFEMEAGNKSRVLRIAILKSVYACHHWEWWHVNFLAEIWLIFGFCQGWNILLYESPRRKPGWRFTAGFQFSGTSVVMPRARSIS